MELALTTLLLLPGVVSLAIATGPRCRAIAPRDLPAAIVAILGFALANFVLAAIACKLHWGAPNLGSSVAAMLTGNEHGGISREDVIASLFDRHEQNLYGLLYLGAATLLTGGLGAGLYVRLLQIIARRESKGLDLQDNRWCIAKAVDWLLVHLGVVHIAIARGASYWLIVEQTAKLLAEKEPEVYADITQGDDSTLFAGQVIQVITSRSGETISVVLKKAQRFRRTIYGEIDPKSGHRRIVKASSWNKIGDSEAFYMRGENIHNISYRVYGDPSRGGYLKSKSGKETWVVPAQLMAALKRRRN